MKTIDSLGRVDGEGGATNAALTHPPKRPALVGPMERRANRRRYKPLPTQRDIDLRNIDADHPVGVMRYLRGDEA